MLPATLQYLYAGIAWFLFFIVIYFSKNWIKKKLKNIQQCYIIKCNFIIYLLIGTYITFVILNIIGIIQHKIVPWSDYLVLFIIMGFVGPVAEEIFFRGFFIGFFLKELDLRKTKYLWIFGVNILFALVHNLGAIHQKPLIELFKTFLLGIVLSFVYLSSKKNILYPSLIHLINNIILLYFVLN